MLLLLFHRKRFVSQRMNDILVDLVQMTHILFLNRLVLRIIAAYNVGKGHIIAPSSQFRLHLIHFKESHLADMISVPLYRILCGRQHRLLRLYPPVITSMFVAECLNELVHLFEEIQVRILSLFLYTFPLGRRLLIHAEHCSVQVQPAFLSDMHGLERFELRFLSLFCLKWNFLGLDNDGSFLVGILKQ